jgi:hypothetical protein
MPQSLVAASIEKKEEFEQKIRVADDNLANIHSQPQAMVSRFAFDNMGLVGSYSGKIFSHACAEIGLIFCKTAKPKRLSCEFSCPFLDRHYWHVSCCSGQQKPQKRR